MLKLWVSKYILAGFHFSSPKLSVLSERSCRDAPTSTRRDKPEPTETQRDKHNRSQRGQASPLLRSDVCRAWHWAKVLWQRWDDSVPEEMVSPPAPCSSSAASPRFQLRTRFYPLLPKLPDQTPPSWSLSEVSGPSLWVCYIKGAQLGAEQQQERCVEKGLHQTHGNLPAPWVSVLIPAPLELPAWSVQGLHLPPRCIEVTH